MEDELDYSKLKYVLYARKSTDDPERQVRSIDDQVAECQLLAIRSGLRLVGSPLVEKKSAKKPNRRPLFTQMLKDIKSGKYDGIVSWHPDRLARNMKEGGEIIDMIDEGEIKDLRFVTHHFSPDANGKMLLGMAFVLSKQYSDKLSQDVSRGVRRNLLEGRTSTPKHGYINEQGRYQPAGKNFELVVKAWQMRKESQSLESIAAFLKDNNYGRHTKTAKVIQITEQRLSKIFKDPFYYGLLIQADQQVDLIESYGFKPAVSEDDYLSVQRLSYRSVRPHKPHRTVFYPLRHMVVCSFCDRNMVVGPSTSSTGKRYLNYRCDNDLCTRETRGIRANEVFNFIYSFLSEGLNMTETEYERYSEDLLKISENDRSELKISLHSKQSSLNKLNEEITDRALKIPSIKNTSVHEINEKEVDRLIVEKEKLEREIDAIKSSIRDPKYDQLTLEQFLNFSKSAAASVKYGSAVEKDKICREIFLNFAVDEEKVLSYQLKEPFATLLKDRKLLNGRGERI